MASKKLTRVQLFFLFLFIAAELSAIWFLIWPPPLEIQERIRVSKKIESELIQESQLIKPLPGTFRARSSSFSRTDYASAFVSFKPLLPYEKVKAHFLVEFKNNGWVFDGEEVFKTGYHALTFHKGKMGALVGHDSVVHNEIALNFNQKIRDHGTFIYN